LRGRANLLLIDFDNNQIRVPSVPASRTAAETPDGRSIGFRCPSPRRPARSIPTPTRCSAPGYRSGPIRRGFIQAARRGAASGPNPLIAEADALLALVPQLRSSAQISDLAQLRVRMVGLLSQFDERLRRRGVGPGQGQKAHSFCAG